MKLFSRSEGGSFAISVPFYLPLCREVPEDFIDHFSSLSSAEEKCPLPRCNPLLLEDLTPDRLFSFSEMPPFFFLSTYLAVFSTRPLFQNLSDSGDRTGRSPLSVSDTSVTVPFPSPLNARSNEEIAFSCSGLKLPALATIRKRV